MFFDICLFYMCVGGEDIISQCTSGGQLMGVSSLLPLHGFWDQTHVVRVGGKVFDL